MAKSSRAARRKQDAKASAKGRGQPATATLTESPSSAGTAGQGGYRDFAALLHPVTQDTFFRDHYDRRPLHIPGGAEKFARLMSWDILNDLLNMTAIWSAASMVLSLDRNILPPRLYCGEAVGRDGGSVRQPDAQKVMALLRKGASLIANDIDTLTPELRDCAAAFENALDAKAQVNLYCSWCKRQAFASHFDTHDVFALHMEGEKVWRIYETRMPHPIRHARFTGMPDDFHAERRGALMQEVRMTPGDLLYIPRGWYHDALAAADGSIHITFGLTGLIGLDVIAALSDVAVDDEAFRRNAPRADAGRAALKKYLHDLSSRLAAFAKDDGFLQGFEGFRAAWRYPRGGFALPIRAEHVTYSLAGPNYRIDMRGAQAILVGPGGAAPIPPGRRDAVAWMLARKHFSRDDFMDSFSRFAAADLERLLADMTAMGVLKRQVDDAE